MTRLCTYLDRYPAKMVSHLADKLADRYLLDCANLLDPFCGSGAILDATTARNFPATGFDVNPYATLLSRVKLDGFDTNAAGEVCEALVRKTVKSKHSLPVTWDAKNYWFTKQTLFKYERLRYVANAMNLYDSRDGRAVLLAYALSVRRCSKADQRSPKPFISKNAIANRKGRHFDPFEEIKTLLSDLAALHGGPTTRKTQVLCVDVRSSKGLSKFASTFSHVITSPPYINAQDYFRNFKLELNLLEDLMPCRVATVRYKFIGTERGHLLEGLRESDFDYHRKLLALLPLMETTHPKQSAVIHRYLADMRSAFLVMKFCLKPQGKLIVVCGDNLVGGYRILTWKVLSRMLEDLGFKLFDRFGDKIGCRNVPPKRQGHVGLIKQEVISAFQLS